MSERRDSIGPYRVRSPAGAASRAEYFVAVPQNGAFQSVILRRTPIAAFDSEASLHEYTNAVKLYATLSHSALVQIYEVFTASGAIVVALEHVEGRSLRDFMNDALVVAPSLPDAAAFFAGLRVFGALAAAHGARAPGSLDVTPVVHGNVRPENILVPWDGYVRLAEFRASQCAMVWRPSPVPADNPYQAPEVKRGDAPTPASDIYSAARVLWELLRGPHASAPPAIRGVMVGAPVERISVLRRDLPKKVTESLDICLSQKPEDRTLSAAQMLSILRSAFVPEEGEQWFISTIARLRSAPVLQGFSGLPADLGDKSWSEQLKVAQDSVGLFAWTGEQAVISDDGPTSEVSTVVTEAKGVPVAPRPAVKPASVPPSGTSAFNVALGASVPPGETRSSPRPPPNVGFDPADLVPSVLPSAFPQYTSVKPVGGGLAAAPVPQGIVQIQMGQASAPPQAPPTPPTPHAPQAPLKAPGPAAPAPIAPAPVAAPAKPGVAPAVPAAPPPVAPKPGPAAPAAKKDAGGGSGVLVVSLGALGVLLLGGAGYVAWSQGVFVKKPAPIAIATDVATAPPVVPTASALPSIAGTVATALSTPTAAPPASASASVVATATPLPTASATATAKPAGAADAEHTVLNTEGAPAGHRVFFDGRVLGEPPSPFTVRCGRHEIRIGSKGTPRNVDLPCGGEYALK